MKATSPRQRREMDFLGQERRQRSADGSVPMGIGDARGSTVEQNRAMQPDEFHAAECAPLFTETLSGARVDRPGLTAALGGCRPGDTPAVDAGRTAGGALMLRALRSPTARWLRGRGQRWRR